MSDFVFSTIWCAAQVSAIAGLACLFSLVLTTQNPASSARVLVASALVLLLVTALCIVPMPDWSPAVMTDSVSVTSNSAPPAVGVEPVEPADYGIGFSLPQIRIQGLAADAVTSVREVVPVESGYGRVWWLGVLAAGLVVGLVRATGGLWSLRCLRRSAEPIDNHESVRAIAIELGEAIGLSCTQIRLCETSEVDCAAVVGFWRSSVLLASDWRDWEPQELKAVLAHELAHVARRDALWRTVAVLASSVHFFNPLVHWLTSRTVLAQELAADRLALKSMGQGEYVRSLSRLALRRDSTISGSRVRTHSLFTPVFAGHLMRRIEMLVAKDCGEDRHGRRWVSSLLVCMVAGLAIVSTAARGIAGPQQQEKKGGDDPPIRTISATTDKKKSSVFTPFSRPSVPANHAAFGDSGAIHVTMAEVMKVPAIRGNLGGLLTSGAFDGIDVSPDELENVSTVSSSLLVAMGTNPDSETPGKNSLQFGVTGVTITTIADVQWRQAIQQRMVGVEESADEPIDYLTASVFGSASIRLVPRSPRELRSYMTYGDDKCPGFEYANASVKPTHPDWKSEWEFLSGGVLTALWRVQKPIVAVSADDRWGKLAEQYNKQIDVCGYAIDFDPELSRIAVRARLRCRDGVSADELKATVMAGLAEFEKELKNEAGQESAKAADIEEYEQMTALASTLLTLVRSSLVTGQSGEREYLSCDIEFALPEVVRRVLNLDGAMVNTRPAK